MTDSAADLLGTAWGPGPTPTLGSAPGRCTLVGEHVDYVGGLIVSCAVGLTVDVAARASSDGCWRVVSGNERAERGHDRARTAGDVADRPLSVVAALEAHGIPVPPLEIAVSASLPAGAGLSSSAALSVATAIACLRHARRTVSARELVDIAYSAEHDVLGIPCGRLDQWTVVAAQDRSALVLDCARDAVHSVPWPWDDTVVIACDTGRPHAIASGEYATRREQATAALAALGMYTVQDDFVLEDLDHLDGVLRHRARHVINESRRAHAAEHALLTGDAMTLGSLMTESHESLRVDYEVSTPLLDAVVQVAREHEGCCGARMVGGGFGGTAIALVDAGCADACAAAMSEAARREGDATAGRTWLLTPVAGAAALCADVVDAGVPA